MGSNKDLQSLPSFWPPETVKLLQQRAISESGHVKADTLKARPRERIIGVMKRMMIRLFLSLSFFPAELVLGFLKLFRVLYHRGKGGKS